MVYGVGKSEAKLAHNESSALFLGMSERVPRGIDFSVRKAK